MVLDNIIKPSILECLAACKIENDCEWYSYNEQNEACYLFESCPEIDESEVDFISGQAECEIPPNSCKF